MTLNAETSSYRNRKVLRRPPEKFERR